MSDVVFTTERLIARRWRPADVAALLAVYGDAEAMRRVDDGQPITLLQCEQWLEVTQANYEKRGYGMFALAEPASGTYVELLNGEQNASRSALMEHYSGN